MTDIDDLDDCPEPWRSEIERLREENAKTKLSLLHEIAELQAALRSIFDAGDKAIDFEDWGDRVSAAMTDEIRALISHAETGDEG